MSKSVKSAERAMEVLVFLAGRAKPVPTMVIAAECALPKSSAYHLLNAMRARDFVTYFPAERAWGLGVAALEIGSAYMRSDPLERAGRRLLIELAEATGETAHLAVLQGTDVLYLLKERPEHFSTRLVTEVGVRLPAHLTAVGRAILMHLRDTQLHALYPSGKPLPRRTNRGPQRASDLLEELAGARRRGFAVDDQMTTPGISCIAAPVFSHDERPLAAVGITFLSASRDERARASLGRQVVDVAARLSRTLGWQGHRRSSAA